MTRKQVVKSKTEQTEQVIDEAPAKVDTPAADEAAETVATIDEVLAETAEEFDDLLDEIEDALEENAELFVQNYVQRGGQ